MSIKELSKLPTPAKDLFDMFFTKVSEKIDDFDTSLRVAWDLTKENYVAPSTVKSANFKQKNLNHSNNYIEVMLGSSVIDGDNDRLNFWKQHPMRPISGDIDHLYYKKSIGENVDQIKQYEGFVPIADRFFNKEDGSLWANVEVPNHSYTPEFLREWENGEYGVSVEYEYPDYAIKHEIVDGTLVRNINEGTIKGFTFTKNPANMETKINEQ